MVGHPAGSNNDVCASLKGSLLVISTSTRISIDTMSSQSMPDYHTLWSKTFSTLFEDANHPRTSNVQAISETRAHLVSFAGGAVQFTKLGNSLQKGSNPLLGSWYTGRKTLWNKMAVDPSSQREGVQ